MNFVEKLAPLAIQHGLANGVLPSLIIAQGILESDSGTSELACNANNLFGIKAGSGWTGETHTKLTAEQDKDGNVTHIDAAFRKYPSYAGCVIDLVHKYTHGTGWEDFNRYAGVLGQTDYKLAIAALKAAGYATDVKYATKLIEQVEKYELTKYDKEVDNVVKIALDAGHGINTPGKQSPADEREWSFNNKVLLACAAALKQYEGVQILRLDDPTGKTDIPLKTRTDNANMWGADALVSFHHNADKGRWGIHGGVETYVQERTASQASKDIAAIIQPRIVAAMGLRNRGVKSKNLHMTRESKMPAILTEGGFMDSTIDITAMRDDTKLKAQGEAIAEGLAIYFKLKKKAGASKQPVKKEEDELEFTSGTLRNTVDDLLNSPAKQKKLIEDGIKAGSFGTVWSDKFEKKQLGKHDILGLYMLHYK
ncbi:N-acetylmuramoyl-L-alanine amidase [Sporosarcina cyprini]|uniref:N-acetylmuramoyl-L-alanine amidase n=1 Tax=Sporosarcina cyprini TaxID=2910523 RepID=UPI001EE0F657|nr:N-acetylmuramoyl-L-alanine amidase [Sporosarcina cyprini]MCG3089116.1 N-acetylmuramoyl-L-alanine amidase [Sporosarcina cyprini]